ncbi:hypothetical protein ABDK00_001625 [Niabella insulamsoli]|uniref:hypothetical protein n=1 Tax=Niabella insulamsoli TaxID=3144874 RepID=UPI0031FDD851
MKKTNTKLFLNIMFNCVMGFVFAALLGINPFIGAVVVNAGGVALNYMDTRGVTFFEGLAQEVWLPLVMEDPYPQASFLNAATDMSSLVDNDKINLAEAGVDPTVLVDNDVYPIAMTDASDTPKEVTLKTYDTTNSVVRNAVAIELAYGQRALYANKHKKALAKKLGMDAAYMYAPAQASGANSNFVVNLGANDSIIDAIIDLQRDFLNSDVIDDLNLVLSPNHLAKLSKEDKELYKFIVAKPGESMYDFKMWRYSKNPIYIGATGVKAAYGAAYEAGTHKYSSFAFVGSEVMRADGSAEMFQRLRDPEARGDIFGFQKRALATTLRGKFSGAILQ